MAKSTQSADLKLELERLSTQLQQTSSVDQTQNDQIRVLDERIKNTLESDTVSYSNLEDALNQSIISFEKDHPELAQTISRIANMLSSVGI